MTISGVTCAWSSSQHGQQRQPQNAGEGKDTPENIYMNGADNSPIYADIVRGSPHGAGDNDNRTSPDIDDGVIYSDLQNSNTSDVYANV